MARKAKGPAFKMRSPHNTTFKMMSSSPMRVDPTDPTTDSTTTPTVDPRIGMNRHDLESGWTSGSTGTTSKAKSEREATEIFEASMKNTKGKIPTGRMLEELLGGKWKKGGHKYGEHVFSNEDGKTVGEVRAFRNPNSAGVITRGDDIIIGTQELDKYGNPTDANYVEEFTKQYGIDERRRRDNM
jgi:hypothetical protein